VRRADLWWSAAVWGEGLFCCVMLCRLTDRVHGVFVAGLMTRTHYRDICMITFTPFLFLDNYLNLFKRNNACSILKAFLHIICLPSDPKGLWNVAVLTEVKRKRKVLPIGRRWSQFPKALSQTSVFTLRDLRYRASVLRGVPVYVPAVKPVPNYTAWWQRHMCVNNLPKVATRCGVEPALLCY